MYVEGGGTCKANTNKQGGGERQILEISSKHFFFFLFEFPVKRVIFVNKNGGVMSKIYCLISWFPISTPLILVSASLKMASVSVAVIYDSTESGHPWRTLHVSVKESGRRPFTLALDWVLVYPTLII